MTHVLAHRDTPIYISSNMIPGKLLGVMYSRIEDRQMLVVSYNVARSGIPAGRPFAVHRNKIMPQACRHQVKGKQGYGYHPFTLDWKDLEQARYVPTGMGLMLESEAIGLKDNRKRKVEEL